MRTAYRCRAYPDEAQQQLLARTFGCVRVVWNHILARRHEQYVATGKGMSYAETDQALTALKKELDWEFLNEVSCVPLQQTLRHQHRAFAAFFEKRSRYPRFKSRHARQSATFTRSAFRMKDGILTLAKMEVPLRFIWSWPDVDRRALDPTSITVSCDRAGRWFVTFIVDRYTPPTLPETGRRVGIDLGLKDFATLSTGEKVAHPRNWDRYQLRLKRWQRRMNRRQLGSANRNKARRKVARLHTRITDSRKDFLHKASTDLVRKHDVVCIEDLNVCGMIRNRKTSHAVFCTGWGEFREMLEYKCERYGRTLVPVNRWFPSSKTCSACGHFLAELDLHTRHWTCPSCGTQHDRDINAAKNILAAGLAAAGIERNVSDACGGTVRRAGATRAHVPGKQETHSVREGPPLRGKGSQPAMEPG